MYQIQGHEPPFKRIRIDRPEIKDVELRRRRAQNDRRLKSIFESIFDKYERDFEGVGDEIDLETGEIVVDNGHVSGLGYQRDVFGHDVGSDVDSESEESEEHRTLGSTMDVYNDDVIEDGCFTGITSPSPRNITPRVSVLKKHPTSRLPNASPLQLCYDSEDELYTGSTASYSLQPEPTVRYNPWLLQRSAITRRDRSISPTWVTPELPRTAPCHFHRRLNTIPATRPHSEHSNGKIFTKRKKPITPRRSLALTLGRPNNTPHSANALSAERQRHGQRKTMSRPPSPCQSESDELGSPEFSQGIPARDADRNRTEKRCADSRSAGPSLVPTPSDSSHDLDRKQTNPVEDVQSAVASPTSTGSLSIRSRSPLLDNTNSAKLVSPIHLEENDIQIIDSFPPAEKSFPSIEQTYDCVRRPKRQRRRKWERSRARDKSEHMQDVIIPNSPAKELSPRPPLKEHSHDLESLVREIPDSDSTLSSQPQLEPASGTPPQVLNAQASGQMLSTNGVRSKKSSQDRERALQDEERPSPVMVQNHSAPPIFRNEIDHEVLQDLGFRSCSVKVVIPLRSEHANIPYRSFDISFLDDEGKADALDTIARTQGLQGDPEPCRILASKTDRKSGRWGGKQIEIPDSQPAREVVHSDCDTDVDLGPRIVPSFIVSDGVMERRIISNTPLMDPASFDSPIVPCTPTAMSTPNTERANEQQRHSLPSANTPKPQSATKSTLSELWDDSDDDLTLNLSSGKPARRSKPVKSGVIIRKSIVPDMATCGDDELG